MIIIKPNQIEINKHIDVNMTGLKRSQKDRKVRFLVNYENMALAN